jgi:fumarylacetoacetase
MDATHNPRRRSWIESANVPGARYAIQNLPLGVFEGQQGPSLCAAIGDQILNLRDSAHVLALSPTGIGEALQAPLLNPLMALGSDAWSTLRMRLSDLLRDDHPQREKNQQALTPYLTPRAEATMCKPAAIGDYTDFYASVDHARNVGRFFRPEAPLLPNYAYVPIGYHGRASSIGISGQAIRRPMGQTVSEPGAAPGFGPCRRLDYECEVGFFVGPGNRQGEPIPIEEAAEHLFGVCLLNDWTARDIQSWEYQPLGPFLAKSFATTLSPWIVTMDALLPFRVPPANRPPGFPPPLPYLVDEKDQKEGAIDLVLETLLRSAAMRAAGMAAVPLSRANLRVLFWTPAQLLAHHTSNGCNLQPGDLLGSGTVSAPDQENLGCLLELTQNGREPLTLPTGESRSFLEDGDEVTLRGYCEREGLVRIALGDCVGTVRSSG